MGYYISQMSEDMASDHVNGNGTEEPMDTTAAVTRSEHFQTLLDAGLPQQVAEKLDDICIEGKQRSPQIFSPSGFLLTQVDQTEQTSHIKASTTYNMLLKML